MEKLNELADFLNEVIKRHNYTLNTNLRLMPEERELISGITGLSEYVKDQIDQLRPEIKSEVEKLKIEYCDIDMKYDELLDRASKEGSTITWNEVAMARLYVTEKQSVIKQQIREMEK
jgi:hypothetical protein